MFQAIPGLHYRPHLGLDPDMDEILLMKGNIHDKIPIVEVNGRTIKVGEGGIRCLIVKEQVAVSKALINDTPHTSKRLGDVWK